MDIRENFKNKLNEAKNPELKKLIRDYAGHKAAAYDSGDFGDDEGMDHHEDEAKKILKVIKKNHGHEAANHAEMSADSNIFGTERKRARRPDSLEGGLRANFRKDLTKKGVIPKNTQKAMQGVAASGEGKLKRKISKPKGIIPEAKDEREYGYEGDMAITQLKTICRNAENLLKMMKPDTDLPEWLQSKITKSEDYISTAHDYMASEMNEEVEQLNELRGKSVAAMDAIMKDASERHGHKWDETKDKRKRNKSSGPADTREEDGERNFQGLRWKRAYLAKKKLLNKNAKKGK